MMNSQLISDEEKGGEVVMMMQQVPYNSTKSMRSYKECLKNHAASLGGNAVDGCREFLPSSSPAGDAALLNCSACGCHRNFHRKEPDDDDIVDIAGRAVEDDNQSQKKKKKRRRFRTKFSKEQKEKLGRFAERAGWRMQKLEGGAVDEFCREIGINRKVLKVWMHNNKHKHTTLPHS